MNSTFCLCFAVIFFLCAPRHGHANELPDVDCHDFIVDKCSFDGEEGVYETVKDVSAEICQIFCSDIFYEHCKFFIHDRKQNVCLIMEESYEAFVSSCIKVGGPKEPAVQSCETSTDVCKYFKEGYCQLHGDLLENLESIPDEAACQLSCYILPECQYYLYDKTQRNCQLHEQSRKTCDFIFGPPSPTIEECHKNPTDETTTATSTSTVPVTSPTTTITTSTYTTPTTTLTTTYTTSTPAITSSITTTAITTTTASTTTTTSTISTITTTASTTTTITTTTFSTPMVKLVDGLKPSEGNVYATNPATGLYGPVCDDNWDINDANVVCRQLGYASAERFLTNSAFGTVSKNFAFDEVACLGTEASIQECPHSDLEDCHPQDGAGVICTSN